MLFIKSHLEILELQNTKGKIKNKVDWFNTRLGIAEKRITKGEDVWVENILTATWREKYNGKNIKEHTGYVRCSERFSHM